MGRWTLLFAIAVVLVAVTWSVAQLFGTPVELVSVNVEGRAGNAASSGPSVDDDGEFVAFFSDASDLVRNDTNEVRDVFVRDRNSGRTERVSISSSGTQANRASHAQGDNPSLDADGGIVAFYSDATNLVPGDRNEQTDVFVRLRAQTITELISVNTIGEQGNGPSLNPSIDGDGRLVAFQSLASNLTPGDTNNVADVFVRDRATALTERICNTVQGNGASFLPDISRDGNVVAFTSAATNFSPIDNNGRLDVYVCDRRTQQLELISVNNAGVPGNQDSILPAISADGRYVAFKSLADNLVPDDRNGLVDVFVRDRVNQTTERISVSFLNRDSNGVSYAPEIDCSGRFVAYGSEATNLVRGDENEHPSVFLRDRAAGLNFLVDVNERGQQADGAALDIAPGVTCTNLLVAYATLASNLTNNDFNEHADVYIQGAPIPTCRIDADCEDNNRCTTDTCGEDGRCLYVPVVCTASDQCHDVGICDTNTGICSNPPKPNGTPCNDQSLCTNGDQCIEGACQGSPIDCSAGDECHDPGVCDPATGLCPNPRPNGTPCDDASLCTSDDRCEGGLCTGDPKDCSEGDECHDAGECNPATGLCPNPRPNGTVCDDEDLCTAGDQCVESICTGTPKDCATADECHLAGECNPATGLCPGAQPDDTPCNDQKLCTERDVCVGSICTGSPINCSVADDCHTAGACNPLTGLCPNPQPDGTPCSDQNLCTIGDQCIGSFCVPGTVKNCSVADACHTAGACNPATGLCPNPQPDGTPCSDQNLCTLGDQCIGSLCVPGMLRNCSTADDCHTAGACNPQTGLCPNPQPDGTPCNDQNLCTIGDQCIGSSCVPGTPKNCSVADDCHTAGACNPTTGLCPNPQPDGTPCSDQNLCTIGDQCVGSFCIPGTSRDCSMADECHDAGACNPTTGLCPNPRPNGTPCNDQNLCTVGDQCVGSFCTPGTPRDCSQPDPCHSVGACNPETGMCPGTLLDGTPCNTGMFCIVNESCDDGTCQGMPRNCDNGLFCDGMESCNEQQNACVSAGNPCPPNSDCDEANDRCIARTPVAPLDKDACECNLDPNAPRSRTAGWIWLSAALGLLVRRRSARR